MNYEENGVVLVMDTFGNSYSWNTSACVPKLFNKTKKIIFKIFFFRYVTKIDKNSKSDGNMNFRCNFINVHFFYLLF